MPHFTTHELNKTDPVPDKASVVVVGAGMAGLYSAWRLKQEKGYQDIVILERSGRTGGRLDSDLVDFGNGNVVKEEEGGMRFLFDGMDDLMALFLKLDLANQIVPFPMNSGGNNRLYFRGHAFDVNESKEDNFAIWSELYNLKPAERGVNPKAIINVVFNRILQANPDFTLRPKKRGPEFWQAFRLECKWNNVPLNEWSLWDLYTEMGYSNECITMLYRLLGFNGTFLSKMNAGVAYQLLEDFPADVKFRTFKDGFSTLPNKLVQEIEPFGSDRKIFLNTQVEAIDKLEGEDCYTVTYSQIHDSGEQVFKTIKAGKLILGLPRLALEKLFIKSNAFNRLPIKETEALWNTLQTASNQPLLKINLYYDSAWWGKKISGRPPVEFGPNFADLPTGSVYPFYSISDEVAAGLEYSERVSDPSPEIKAKLDLISASKYKKPAALTIYCDYLNINYWSGLQNNGPLFTSKMQEDHNKAKPQTVFAASQAVVREATKYFKDIFNTHYVPEPMMTSARIWEGSVEFDVQPSQQFGYGVHQWAIGANDKKVMDTLKQLKKPLDNIFICGEAFSDYQGWVEGALRSADLALAAGFGLKALSQKYKDDTGHSPSNAIKAAYYENVTSMIRDYIDPNYQPGFIPPFDEIEELEHLETCLGVDLTYMDQE